MSGQRQGRARMAGRRDRWLVSYADLMTVLFALFVVLFARAHEKTGFAAPRAEVQARETSRQRRADLRTELGVALARQIAAGTVLLAETPEGIVVRLREVGAFASGEAVPLPGAVAVVEQMSPVVVHTGVAVRVEGHTDDQGVRSGVFRSNWELSTARAEATLRLLLAERGIVPERMSVAGYGPYRPVASNATEAGRRSNRRVDLVVLCPP